MTRRLPSRARIPAGSVTLGADPAVLSGDAPPGAHADPAGHITVTPVMDGRIVRRLLIQCSCGQTTEVECTYQEEKR